MGNGDARKSSPNVAHHYVLWVSISSRPTRDFHLCPTVSRLEICPIFHSLHLFALSINFNYHAPLNSGVRNPRSLDFPLSSIGNKKNSSTWNRDYCVSLEEEEEWRVFFPKKKKKRTFDFECGCSKKEAASFFVIRIFRSQKSSQVFKSLTSCCP